MGMIKIQAVCGFGCGSSLFLKMKIQEVLKENDLEAEIFCGDVGTCTSTPCDVIFTSEELAARVAERSTVPVVTICNFVNKKEVTEKRWSSSGAWKNRISNRRERELWLY